MLSERINGLMSTNEAAKYLGLAPVTLESWRCRGKGPVYFKISGMGKGGKVKYRLEDLEAWLGERRVVPEPTRAD